MGYAVRTDRYRYVEWRKRGSKDVVARELYDHTNDPGEDTNKAIDPASEPVMASLAQVLAEGWQKNAPPK
jgi:arylsulfatase A-like enzyme